MLPFADDIFCFDVEENKFKVIAFRSLLFKKTLVSK